MRLLVMANNKAAIVKAGWVFGNSDGFVGERIYPVWQGALEGKRLTCRDIRVFNGVFLLHNPWSNQIEKSFDSLPAVESYILENGNVVEAGANVWE